MTDYRTTDGEGTTHTTIIEKSGGGAGTILLALVLLLAVAVGGWYLFTTGASQTHKNDAIAGAADSVSKTADKVGSAVDQSK